MHSFESQSILDNTNSFQIQLAATSLSNLRRNFGSNASLLCTSTNSTTSQSQVAQPVNGESRKRKGAPVETEKNIKMLLALRIENPVDYKFTLKCPFCDKKFATINKGSLKFNFKRHCKSIIKCKLSEKKIDQVIEKIIKPRKIHKYFAPCPFEECKFSPKDKTIWKLRSKFLAHVNSQKHPDNPEKAKKRKLITNKESFEKYFKQYGTTYSILNPKFVSNSNKRKKLQH